MPPADTLPRVLSQLAVAQLEQAHGELLRRLLRNQTFRRYWIAPCYPIAIDGSQQLVRNGQWWDEHWLARRRDTADGESVQPSG